jgi:hypothetical protein
MSAVTYHVYLTYNTPGIDGSDPRVFLTEETQGEAFKRVWNSRNVLDDYRVILVVTPSNTFADLTHIVQATIEAREHAAWQERMDRLAELDEQDDTCHCGHPECGAC